MAEQSSKLDKLDKADIAFLVQEAERQANLFKKDGLKTSQLRNFYSAILRIRQMFETGKGEYTSEIKSQLVLLKPKLAFAAGRQTAVRKSFKPFMDTAINGVLAANDKEKALEHFLALIESVVAYHKFVE